MKKTVELWPIFLLLCWVPVSYFLHVDYIFIPYFQSLKLFTNFQILILAGILGLIGLLVWYIGWSNFSLLILQWIKEDINFGKKIAGELEAEGYIDQIKIHFSRRYYKLINPQNKAAKFIKAGGYTTMFIAGITPIGGLRSVGSSICGIMRWKRGLAVLAIGNFLKTASFVYAWSLVFT